MSQTDPVFAPLASDDVFLEAALASDVASLWRRMSACPAVIEVARRVASNPELIHDLCEFIETHLNTPHEPSYRHPSDAIICASLVVLAPSPLHQVRNIFTRLSCEIRPSLTWVRRVAEYCEEMFTPTATAGFGFPPTERIFVPEVEEHAGVTWSSPGLERERYTLPTAA